MGLHHDRGAVLLTRPERAGDGHRGRSRPLHRGIPRTPKPSDTATWCAYKGRAGYRSYGDEDVAWTYEEPLHDAEQVRDLVCFFNERVDLQGRPRSRWS
jgi:Domain of unknown function (DUF427)